VFVNDQNLTAINASNNANATSYACVRCTNIAEAYQIIVATDEQTHLTFQQRVGLTEVRFALEGLRWYGLSPDRIQKLSDALANKAVSIVDNPDYGMPGQGAQGGGPLARAAAVSPAISGSAQPAALTETTQPVVDLYVDVKVST
jgi:hypothetical protein